MMLKIMPKMRPIIPPLIPLFDFTIRLSETQVAILTLIKENKYITTNEISDKLNKELSTIKKSIKVLKDAGILVRIGTNRTGYWKIVEEGKED